MEKKKGGGEWISDIMDWTHVAFWVEKGGYIEIPGSVNG